MEWKFIFAWYDIWIGFFWDREAHWLYIFPIPMCGIIVKFPPPKGFRILYNDRKGYKNAWDAYRYNKQLLNKHYD